MSERQARAWMRTPVVVDGRHVLSAAEGFVYRGVGFSAASAKQ